MMKNQKQPELALSIIPLEIFCDEIIPFFDINTIITLRRTSVQVKKIIEGKHFERILIRNHHIVPDRITNLYYFGEKYLESSESETKKTQPSRRKSKTKPTSPTLPKISSKLKNQLASKSREAMGDVRMEAFKHLYDEKVKKNVLKSYLERKKFFKTKHLRYLKNQETMGSPPEVNSFRSLFPFFKWYVAFPNDTFHLWVRRSLYVGSVVFYFYMYLLLLTSLPLLVPFYVTTTSLSICCFFFAFQCGVIARNWTRKNSHWDDALKIDFYRRNEFKCEKGAKFYFGEWHRKDEKPRKILWQLLFTTFDTSKNGKVEKIECYDSAPIENPFFVFNLEDVLGCIFCDNARSGSLVKIYVFLGNNVTYKFFFGKNGMAGLHKYLRSYFSGTDVYKYFDKRKMKKRKKKKKGKKKRK